MDLETMIAIGVWLAFGVASVPLLRPIPDAVLMAVLMGPVSFLLGVLVRLIESKDPTT
jgi:hypothetical protein